MQIQPHFFQPIQSEARTSRALQAHIANSHESFNFDYLSAAQSYQSLNQGWQAFMGGGFSDPSSYQLQQMMQMVMGFVQALSSQLFAQNPGNAQQPVPMRSEYNVPDTKAVAYQAAPTPYKEEPKAQPAPYKAAPKLQPAPYKEEPKAQPAPRKEEPKPTPPQLRFALPGHTEEGQLEYGSKEWAQKEFEANVSQANGIIQNDDGTWQVDWIGSPVVLDLDGDGKLDLTGKDGKKIEFDLLGDGTRLKTEWLKEGTKDGLLVADFNKNGKIDSGRELMRKTGINGEQNGYRNGWEKVREVFDANNDGKINGKELEGLQVWVDSNGDGITDDGELRSLASQGVSEIVVPKAGEMVSSFTRNGNRQLAEDVIFDVELLD